MNPPERSRLGVGSLTGRIQVNGEKVTMSLSPNVEMWDHNVDPNRHAFKTSCHLRHRAGNHDATASTISSKNHHGASHLSPSWDEVCTARSSSDLKTQLRVRRSNIVRRALQLSNDNDDCLNDRTTTTTGSSTTMTPNTKKKYKAMVLTTARGLGEGTNVDQENRLLTGEEKDDVERSFQLSALASALPSPIYDLGEELWQSDLSYLFGPMGPAFGGREGEWTRTNDPKGELLSMSLPDNEKLVCRSYQQEQQEVAVESSTHSPATCLAESSTIVVSPLKRQRGTKRISSASSRTGASGLRRASMNFHDLLSM